MAAKSMEDIAVDLQELKFRKKSFGGVDEADVWRKLEKLQGEYQAAFDAQDERSRALIQERDAQIRQLKAQLGRLLRAGGDANA